MSKAYKPKGPEYRMLVQMPGDEKLSIYKGTFEGVNVYKGVKILFKQLLNDEKT